LYHHYNVVMQMAAAHGPAVIHDAMWMRRVAAAEKVQWTKSVSYPLILT
jgi:hypothetical protein